MGQTLMKFGNEEKKQKEIGPVIEECYDKFFGNSMDWSPADYHHAICQSIEEMNKTLGSTQLRVPTTSTLQHAYQKHHEGKGKSLAKEEFEKILKELIRDTGVTNIGAKDLLFYLFGVPATALLFKQRLAPKLMPNHFFIPVITSSTVFLLAKLNKL